MKVLLQIRGDVARFPGGDYVQLLETKAALEQLGVTCTVAPGLGKQDGYFDIVHLFNTTRIHETYMQYRAAKAKGQRVVLSPIWHSLEDMRRFYGHLYHLPFFPIHSYLAAKEFFYARRSGLPVHPSASLRFRAMQRELVRECDAILPNSQTELDVITNESGTTPRASFISPLGLTRTAATATHAPRRNLICAGRIEPRKNQLAVVRAFKRLPRTDRKLRLYGQRNDSHPKYAKRVLAECVEGWVEYGGSVSHDSLMAAYDTCHTAVLMSFFETFGLAALEGLAAGATLCLSDTAYNRGIYGDRAVYANPYSEDAITRALSASLDSPLTSHDDFLQPYTWENAARTTLQAYQHVTGS
ncbi:MAG TPA: glycosyltransferase [Chthoniobacterales bacterium]|jgi:glycosyltransferase involved in cell wall biosynthesis